MAGLELDIADDYLVADGLEPCVVFVSASTSDSMTFLDAIKRSQVTRREAEQSKGRYTQQDERFIVPVALCGFKPSPGDIVTWKDFKADIIGFVLAVDTFVFKTKFGVYVRSLNIDPARADSVDLQTAIAGRTASGGAYYEYAPAKLNVQAVVHRLSVSLVEKPQFNERNGQFMVYLLDSVDPDTFDHLLWQGKSLRVLEANNLRSIEKLTACRCVIEEGR